MLDFKAKMHQIQFRLGAGGAYSAPPDPLAGFKGPISKGREGKGRGRRRNGSGKMKGVGGRKKTNMATCNITMIKHETQSHKVIQCTHDK